jgi:hypothetical protein
MSEVPDEIDWTLTAGDLPQPELLQPARKFRLWDLIVNELAEADRIDQWDTTLHEEGKCLTQFQTDRRDMARQTAKTLQLLEVYEREFVALVKKLQKSRVL